MGRSTFRSLNFLHAISGRTRDDSGMDITRPWEFVADNVMGGVSSGHIKTLNIKGRIGTRLTGDVSFENNGGVLQMAFDINDDGSTFNASGFDGVEIDVLGNDESYDLRLRTSELTRPWQSYRTSFFATTHWTTVRIPFANFKAHKTDICFKSSLLRRIGVLAIGRVFAADISVSRFRLIK